MQTCCHSGHSVYTKSQIFSFNSGSYVELRLIKSIDDRRISLHVVRYKNEITPIMTVVVWDADNGQTIAEVLARGTEVFAALYKKQSDAWHSFVE